MIITTDGGTTFTVKNNVVTITRSDQPECSVPVADLREFLGLVGWLDLDEDEDDDVE